MDRKRILSEISRTAEANGGVPLGAHRFYRETGIKISDWQGKLWVRWGDALREAGFEPNRMQGAYDETLLAEKFIALVRELGHFPVHGELRMKAYQDPNFPSHNTFSKWGSKQQIAARIRNYCKEHTGHEDVLKLCAAIPDIPPNLAADVEPEDSVGSVYLIKSGRYYKIGCTNSVGRREYELAIQLPERASLVHTIRTDDPNGIEAYWHRRFASKRKKGEWFELDSHDVKAFRRRKFM